MSVLRERATIACKTPDRQRQTAAQKQHKRKISLGHSYKIVIFI
jgi:hypothetical protein